MFIYLQPGSALRTEELINETVKQYYESRCIQFVKINPHIDMKAADGSIVVGWLASQTDMQATDWEVFEP